MSEMSEWQEKDIFLQYIARQITQYPDWASDAINAVTSGTVRALDAAHRRNAEMNVALMCALSLAEKKRMSKPLIEKFNSLICRGIGEPDIVKKYGSPFEKEQLEKYTE